MHKPLFKQVPLSAVPNKGFFWILPSREIVDSSVPRAIPRGTPVLAQRLREVNSRHLGVAVRVKIHGPFIRNKIYHMPTEKRVWMEVING